MNDRQLTGLILAGGQSRRMGQNKALLRYQSQTFQDHCHQILKQAGCHKVFTSSNELADGINDNFVDIGPVAGIEAGLRHAVSNGYSGLLLVMPVDMIKLSPASLMALVDNIGAHDLLGFDNFPLPLVMQCHSAMASEVTRLATGASEQDGMSIKSMSRALNSITIPTINSEDMLNINEPADLDKLNLTP